MMDPGHQGLVFVGFAQAVRDDGLRWAKGNWQILGLAAALVAGGTRALAEVETLGQRVAAMEVGQAVLADKATEAATTAANVLGEIRELRKDLRARKPSQADR
jgi:hypothetical protein